MNTNRQLLVEYLPFTMSSQQITEAITQNNGKLIVFGILQRANAKNHNGRIYPRDILVREASKYKSTYISENRAVGELDHPDSSVVNLKNVSHNILDLYWKGNDLMGKIEILSTPSGNILKELLKAGIRLGISSRGIGSVKQIKEDTVEVQDDYEILCWDMVSNPSTQGAFMNQHITESVNPMKQIDKYAKLNQLISDILKGE